MPEEVKRGFKGIWIPKEIWLNDELTLQEKVFLVEINSLDNDDGCFASNDYFADFFGLTKNRASEIIQALISKGFIKSKILITEGNKRILRIDQNKISTLSVKSRRPYPTKVGDPIPLKLEYNNIYNNTVNKNIVTTLQQPEAAIVKTDKRNPDIQEVYDFALSKGFAAVKQQYQRYAIKRLLAKMDKDKLLRLVEFSQQIRTDQYAPQVNTFLDLENKLQNLRDYVTRKKQSTQKSKIAKI